MIPTWPSSRLGEAIEALAGASNPAGAKVCPATDDLLQGRWIEAVSACVGLESEPLEIAYGDLERKLKTVGPALFRLPDQTFVALLQNGRVLAPDLSVRRVKPKTIAHLLAQHLEAPLQPEVDRFLQAAEIPRRRRARARAAILRERLSGSPLGPCWSL